jgi:hypothetical protein
VFLRSLHLIAPLKMKALNAIVLFSLFIASNELGMPDAETKLMSDCGKCKGSIGMLEGIIQNYCFKLDRDAVYKLLLVSFYRRNQQ